MASEDGLAELQSNGLLQAGLYRVFIAKSVFDPKLTTLHTDNYFVLQRWYNANIITCASTCQAKRETVRGVHNMEST